MEYYIPSLFWLKDVTSRRNFTLRSSRRRSGRFMDENTLLTGIVVSYSADDEVIIISQLCRSAYRIAFRSAEVANNRNIFARLDDLRDLSGGDTEAEVRAERDSADFEYWIRHVASDWDFSDD